MSSTVLAVGAHIGDMDLTAGPILAKLALSGSRVVIVAYTNGESGHPDLPPAVYREQKLREGRDFARDIGADFVSLGYQDGYLPDDEAAAGKLVDVIRSEKPDVILTHWTHSIHRDHARTSALADRARFLASLPRDDGQESHRVQRMYYANNWEDSEAYVPDSYVSIPPEAYEVWRAAIEKEAFARGETGFHYIDYYAASLKLKGALYGTQYAAVLKSARLHIPELEQL